MLGERRVAALLYMHTIYTKVALTLLELFVNIFDEDPYGLSSIIQLKRYVEIIYMLMELRPNIFPPNFPYGLQYIIIYIYIL